MTNLLIFITGVLLGALIISIAWVIYEKNRSKINEARIAEINWSITSLLNNYKKNAKNNKQK